MENDDRLRDVDKRVVDALEPDATVVRRVMNHAFEERAAKARPSRLTAGAIAAVAIVSVFGVAWYARRDSRIPIAPTLTITGNGSSIVVQRSDGRRWFVEGEPPPQTSGSYIIVVPNHGEMK